ncbi:MAG: thioredoxin-disulfide reductase [Methanobacteriaceae archaeon]
MEEYDIIIIGAGPAGLTAALYSGRQNFRTLILEKMITGGVGAEVPMMENFPGFEIIAGKQLIELMKKQALKHSEIREKEEVKKVELVGDKIELSADEKKYLTRAIIISTGSKHRQLKVPGELEFLGRGVCYCATCDGPLYQGKKVLIIGGGNSATQEALYLENIGVNVALVHRRDELRAENYLQDMLKEKDIPIFWDSVVKEIMGGDTGVKSVVLHNRKTGENKEVEIDGIFISIGDVPSNQVAASIGVELDSNGYIITDKSQRTNLPRVYAAGDITGGVKQWVVACSEGAIAALSAYEDLIK